MLQQCSRGTPPAYDGHWQPQAEDIAAWEAALPGALRPGDSEVAATRPRAGVANMAASCAAGTDSADGNFFPRDVGEGHVGDNDWRRVPVMVYDGGHAFFGVEYDVEARRITHTGFNGFA